MASPTQDRQQNHTGQGQNLEQGDGAFIVQLAYEPPHLGVCQGRLVSIAAIGNKQGFSPANLIQGEGENQRVVSIDDVRDLTLWPATTQEMRDLLSGGGQQEQRNYRGR